MEKVDKFDPSKIEIVVFDVDGTFYNKEQEYISGVGSIQTAHDFFRYLAFQRLCKGTDSPQKIAEDLVSEYHKRIIDQTLKKRVASISDSKKARYANILTLYKSNGQLFTGEFGVSSTYLHEMLKYIKFESVLKANPELQSTFSYLKAKGYDLGILTTEVFETVKAVADVMGFDLSDFYMNTGDKYQILCAENVKQKKPSLEGFIRLNQIYGVDDPSKIVYVGDVFSKDVEPPLKCGQQAIQIVNSGSPFSIASVNVDGIEKEYAKINCIYLLKEIL